MFSHCQNCLRPLDNPESRKLGFGPDCREELGQQAVWIDAGKSAIKTGASDDTNLRALGRILQRLENKALEYGEDQIVPEVVVYNLRKIRRDFVRRARYLNQMGWLFVPEPEIQIAQVAAA